MKRERKNDDYLLELTRRYRQFPTLWGTVQSMLLLAPNLDRWRIMAASTDYIARSIFVDAMQRYFQESPEQATSIMHTLLDEKSTYSTQTVLRAAREIGKDALLVFSHAMKSKSLEKQRILVNFLYSLSKEDKDFYFFLYNHYGILTTPFSFIRNSNMAIGSIQNFMRIVSVSTNAPAVLQRCNEGFQQALDNLHLKKFAGDGFIDKTVQALILKTLPFLMSKAMRGGFVETIVLHDFEDLKKFYFDKKEQQKAARLGKYFNIHQMGIESEIESLQYMLEEAPIASKDVTLAALAVQVNRQEASLDFYRKLFDTCSGYGRAWLQMPTFALFIPTSYPPNYLELLEELAKKFIVENRQHLFEHRILLQSVIDCPFLSLYFAYYREGVADMPLLKSFIERSLQKNDLILAQRLIETLFPLGIFYPEFTLNFVEQYLDFSNERIAEPILQGLALLLPLHPEIVDLHIEKWQCTTRQKDMIYSQIDDERAYRATDFLMFFNMCTLCFLSKSALKPLGFEVVEHFLTSDSLDEALEKIALSMLNTLKIYDYDLVKIFLTPLSENNKTIPDTTFLRRN